MEETESLLLFLEMKAAEDKPRMHRFREQYERSFHRTFQFGPIRDFRKNIKSCKAAGGEPPSVSSPLSEAPQRVRTERAVIGPHHPRTPGPDFSGV